MERSESTDYRIPIAIIQIAVNETSFQTRPDTHMESISKDKFLQIFHTKSEFYSWISRKAVV